MWGACGLRPVRAHDVWVLCRVPVLEFSKSIEFFCRDYSAWNVGGRCREAIMYFLCLQLGRNRRVRECITDGFGLVLNHGCVIHGLSE